MVTVRTSDGKKARASAVSAADFKDGRDLTQETMVKRGGEADAVDDAAIYPDLPAKFRNRRHRAGIIAQQGREEHFTVLPSRRSRVYSWRLANR